MTDFLLLSASVMVSWKIPDHTHVDGYKIEFNTSKETVVFTNKTQVSLEIDYKRVLIYTISAFNCYGKSEDVADEIFIGIKSVLVPLCLTNNYTFSWLCSSESTSQWECW